MKKTMGWIVMFVIMIAGILWHKDFYYLVAGPERRYEYKANVLTNFKKMGGEGFHMDTTTIAYMSHMAVSYQKMNTQTMTHATKEREYLILHLTGGQYDTLQLSGAIAIIEVRLFDADELCDNTRGHHSDWMRYRSLWTTSFLYDAYEDQPCRHFGESIGRHFSNQKQGIHTISLPPQSPQEESKIDILVIVGSLPEGGDIYVTGSTTNN